MDEVFILAKAFKRSARSGFLRLRNASDSPTVLRYINAVWIGTHKLSTELSFYSIPFTRSQSQSQSSYGPSKGRPNIGTQKGKVDSRVFQKRDHRSYVEVPKGNSESVKAEANVGVVNSDQQGSQIRQRIRSLMTLI